MLAPQLDLRNKSSDTASILWLLGGSLQQDLPLNRQPDPSRLLQCLRQHASRCGHLSNQVRKLGAA